MARFHVRLLGLLVALSLVLQTVVPGLTLADARKDPVAQPSPNAGTQPAPNAGAAPAPAPGEDAVEAEWAETAFDVGSLILSLHDFSRDRSFWNGFWVLADGVSVVIPGVPGVPALSLFKRGAAATREFIQQSPKLHRALTTGVMSYGRLSNVKIGDDFRRHRRLRRTLPGNRRSPLEVSPGVFRGGTAEDSVAPDWSRIYAPLLSAGRFMMSTDSKV